MHSLASQWVRAIMDGAASAHATFLGSCSEDQWWDRTRWDLDEILMLYLPPLLIQRARYRPGPGHACHCFCLSPGQGWYEEIAAAWLCPWDPCPLPCLGLLPLSLHIAAKPPGVRRCAVPLRRSPSLVRLDNYDKMCASFPDAGNVLILFSLNM